MNAYFDRLIISSADQRNRKSIFFIILIFIDSFIYDDWITFHYSAGIRAKKMEKVKNHFFLLRTNKKRVAHSESNEMVPLYNSYGRTKQNNWRFWISPPRQLFIIVVAVFIDVDGISIGTESKISLNHLFIFRYALLENIERGDRSIRHCENKGPSAAFFARMKDGIKLK